MMGPDWQIDLLLRELEVAMRRMCRLEAGVEVNETESQGPPSGRPFVICYNPGMSKPEAKTPVAPATPTPNPKAFTGIKRVEGKVLKPGTFNPTEAVRRYRDR
jgi:hypothetical protein